MAAVCCASTSRRAMVARRLVMRSRRLGALAPLAQGAGALGALRCLGCLARCRCRGCRCRGCRCRRRLQHVLLGHAGRWPARRLRASRRAPSRRSAPSAWPFVGRLGTAAPRHRVPLGWHLRHASGTLVPQVPGAAAAPFALSSSNGEHLADLHVGAFLVLDAREHAGAIGADFEVDLLGLELDQRLAGSRRCRPPSSATSRRGLRRPTRRARERRCWSTCPNSRSNPPRCEPLQLLR